MEQLKYILKYLLSIITNPDQTWSYLDDLDLPEAKLDYMQRNYYYPLLAVASAAVLVFGCFYAYDSLNNMAVQEAVSTGMKAMVPFLVAYFVSPFIIVRLIKEVSLWMDFGAFDSRKLEVFVGYAISYIIFIEVVCAVLPRIRLILYAAVYLVYIVWNASSLYLKVQEHHRWTFSVIVSGIIYFVPFVIEKLLQFIEK